MKKITLSIIIATHNREAILWRSVQKAIEAADAMPVEIIVVNDGKQPLKIPLPFADKILCFTNPGKGVSSARNYGVSKSSGTVLFFLDDDMWATRQSIHWIIAYMGNAENAGAVYNLNWQYPPSLNKQLLKSKVGNFILDSQYNTMWGRMHQNGAQPSSGLYKYFLICSGSMVMHKNVFNALGGYNEQLVFQGEDADLSNRANGLSIPIFCVFDVVLLHNQADRVDLDGYLKRLNQGYRSQFIAEKSGAIPASPNVYKSSKKYLFETFRLSEKAWLVLYKLIPNHAFFYSATNKLTGVISALQSYKQWKKYAR